VIVLLSWIILKRLQHNCIDEHRLRLTINQLIMSTVMNIRQRREIQNNEFLHKMVLVNLSHKELDENHQLKQIHVLQRSITTHNADKEITNQKYYLYIMCPINLCTLPLLLKNEVQMISYHDHSNSARSNSQWRKLGPEFGGTKNFFLPSPQTEKFFWGGAAGTHCILELDVGWLIDG